MPSIPFVPYALPGHAHSNHPFTSHKPVWIAARAVYCSLEGKTRRQVAELFTVPPKANNGLPCTWALLLVHMGAASPTACSPDLTPEASPLSVCSLLLAGCLVGAQEDAAVIPYGGSGADRGDSPYPTWRRLPETRPSKPSKPSMPGKPGPPHPVPDPSQPAPSCPGCAAVLCPRPVRSRVLQRRPVQQLMPRWLL
jgi:hypothetical protein